MWLVGGFICDLLLYCVLLDALLCGVAIWCCGVVYLVLVSVVHSLAVLVLLLPLGFLALLFAGLDMMPFCCANACGFVGSVVGISLLVGFCLLVFLCVCGFVDF